ncbi:hypothetical protein V2I01_28810 [Micromonospora sp. BRA006-A]|nr:hypothetical protein [Micromonospora sp. BRA006-A]
MPELAGALAAGDLDLGPLVSGTVPLTEAPAALERLARGEAPAGWSRSRTDVPLDPGGGAGQPPPGVEDVGLLPRGRTRPAGCAAGR